MSWCKTGASISQIIVREKIMNREWLLIVFLKTRISDIRGNNISSIQFSKEAKGDGFPTPCECRSPCRHRDARSSHWVRKQIASKVSKRGCGRKPSRGRSLKIINAKIASLAQEALKSKFTEDYVLGNCYTCSYYLTLFVKLLLSVTIRDRLLPCKCLSSDFQVTDFHWILPNLRVWFLQKRTSMAVGIPGEFSQSLVQGH